METIRDAFIAAAFTGSAQADSNEEISPTAPWPAAPDSNQTIETNEGIEHTATGSAPEDSNAGIQPAGVDFDIETNAGADIATLVDVVARRLQDNIFPMVQPKDVQDCEVAQQTLTLAEQCEVVELQSFMDDERAKFLESDVVSPNIPPAMKNAHFARDSYYYLMRRFLVEKSLRERMFAHRVVANVFIPLVPATVLNAGTLQKTAAHVCSLMQAINIPGADAMLWKKWALLEENCVPYSEEPLSQIFEEFLKDEYYATLEEAIRLHDSYPKVKVSVDKNASTPEEIEERTKLVQSLSQQQLENVENEVRSQWAELSKQFPANIRAKQQAEAPKKFWEKHYYSVMAQLYQDVPSSTTSQSGSEALCALSSTSLIPVVAAADVTSCTQSGSASTADLDPSTTSHSGSASTGNVEPITTAVFGISSLLDGTAYLTEVPMATIWNQEFLSSKNILEAEKESNGPYEGWLIYHPDAARMVKVRDYSKSPSKRSSEDAQKIEKEVLDLVLLDDTGPVMVSLWGDNVSSFFSQKQSRAGKERHLVNLSVVSSSKLQKNDWNGVSLSTIRCVSSVAARGQNLPTQVTITDQRSSPFIDQVRFVTPGPQACITSFQTLRSIFIAPFRGTFAGMVADVQGASESVRGNAKKFFNLVDANGYWILCCALGRNAGNQALYVGAVIVI